MLTGRQLPTKDLLHKQTKEWTNPNASKEFGIGAIGLAKL